MIVWPLQCTTFLVSTLSFVGAQAPWPGAVPLAIRSPHFNSWLPSPGQQQWPTFWNDPNRTLGWMGYIRIDGITWEWLGPPGRSGNLTKTEITPTRTILTFVAGPMEVEVTFLSPIEPTDLVRQSFPFAYISLTAKATDGANHSVQVYSDISAEWVSGDSNNEVTWSTTPGNDLVFHQVQRALPESMQEINDQAEDAIVYYAMANSSDVTWQTGHDTAIRKQFIGNLTTGGKLSNTQGMNFRAINKDWPVFSLSVDFGNISAISTPVVWALGVVRNPVIRYGFGDGSTQQRSSFFWTQYNTIGDAIGAFVKDFPNALQRAVELDQKITSDALSISQDYADLVSLSVRQTVGSIDITTSREPNGQWNTSDIMMFMKSVGDTSRRANPTEFMFAAFPAFLYLNASWAGFLLRPGLHQQSIAIPTSAYAIPDLACIIFIRMRPLHLTPTIGSGNMIIMALAHAKASGDGSLISRYYPLLKNWANYLAVNALNQTMFTTSDGRNGPNLAIQGIVGIRAMGEISQILGRADDALRFKDQASAMLQGWENRTILSSHITSIYGQSTSWGLIYNLFSDRLLKLDFITQEIYNNQTNFYSKQIPAGKREILLQLIRSYFDIAGAPPDWTMLTAATTTDNSTRNNLVSMVRSRAWLNNRPEQFPTDYSAASGQVTGMGGRPAQGAMFAFLALKYASMN
ncbi:DUF1793-domain-containing protein [Infundibulicybe gibba]|nr:DUF1793-domain-containing protein [Infundibulicybe gibba]